MRRVIGVAAGLVLAWLMAIVLKFFSDYMFAPAALDPSDPEQARQIISLMPAAGLISMLLIFFLSTLCGSFVAARVAHARWAAWATGGLMLLITGVRAVMGGYPAWLMIATVAVIGAAGWLAGALAGDGAGERDDDDEDDLAYETHEAPAAAYGGWDPAPEAPADPVEAHVEPAHWPEEAPHADDDLFDAPEPEPDRPRWTPLPPRGED